MTKLQHVFIPINEAVKPRNGECLTNRWWVVKDDSIILWRGFSPQCNSNEAIARSVAFNVWPGAEVRFIPAVFIGRLAE